MRIAREYGQAYSRTNLPQGVHKCPRPLHTCRPEIRIPGAWQIGRIGVISAHADPRGHCVKACHIKLTTTITSGQIAHTKRKRQRLIRRVHAKRQRIRSRRKRGHSTYSLRMEFSETQRELGTARVAQEQDSLGERKPNIGWKLVQVGIQPGDEGPGLPALPGSGRSSRRM